MLIACLIAESMQRLCFAFADPLWPCFKVNVVDPWFYRLAKVECNRLDIVWDIAS